MAQGYLVTLGDGSLDTGDTISGPLVTFTEVTRLGEGSWIWSGVWAGDGNTYNNIFEPGVFWQADNGNIYFAPDNWEVTTINSGTVNAVPTGGYSTEIFGTNSDDAVVDGSDAAETLYGGASTSTTNTGNDTITAGAGDDTVFAGSGADTIFGQAGDDTIEAGDGNDEVFGDRTDAPDRVVFRWSAAEDPSTPPAPGSGFVNGSIDDGDDLSGSFTQDVNGVTVTYSYQANPAGTTDGVGGSDTAPLFDDAAAFVTGINSGGATVDANSANLFGGDLATNGITLAFSQGVENISFRVNDIDSNGVFRDGVQIIALDETGTAVPVVITLGSSLTALTAADAPIDTSATGGIFGARAGTTSFSGADPEASMLVEIAGPVSSLQIIYNDTQSTGDDGLVQVSDIYFDEPAAPAGNDSIDAGAGNDTVFGEDGDDTIEGGTGTDSLYGGDGNDTITDSGTQGDIIEGGDGDDSISAGAGSDSVSGDAGADSIDGGSGADTLFGGEGTDTIAGGSGADTIEGGADADSLSGDGGADSIAGDGGDDTLAGDGGNDRLFGGADNDTLFGGANNDTLDGGTGNDSLDGGTGVDQLDGGADNDTLAGGDGDDTLSASAGDDTNFGGTGNDTFIVGDNSDAETITGGEDVGDGDVDVVDFTTPTTSAGVTVDFTGAEAGNYSFDGTAAAGSFTEIERIDATDFDDTIDAADNTSDLTIVAGSGGDTITSGQGNDTIDLSPTASSGPDGDADVIVLTDGFGNDLIQNFDAPTPNGDGSFTGIDTFDVTGLNDEDSAPVNTNDVDVTDDGFGNAVLTFPNGESVTLEGISPTDASDPLYLNAIGIPLPPPDGIVTGTQSNDVIDGSYTGDLEGDLVDAGDELVAGEGPDDDIIVAQGGDDRIFAGVGNDDVYGGDGSDTIDAGAGDDTVYGDTPGGAWYYEYYDLDPTGEPNNLAQAGFANDSADFEGIPTEVGYTDTIAAAAFDTADDYALKFSSILDVTTGGTYTFTTSSDDGSKLFVNGVEVVDNDGQHATATETGTITLPPGEHLIEIIYFENNGGNTLSATIEGPDTGGSSTDLATYDGLRAATGADTITGGTGNDTLFGGGDSDLFNIGEADDTDTITGGEDADGLDIDTVSFDSVGTTDGVDVSFTGDEAADYQVGTSGSDGDFVEIERVLGTDNADTVDLTADSSGITVEAGSGDDTVTSGQGDDSIAGGTGQDDIVINDDFGNDVVDGGAGADGTGDVLDGNGLTQAVTVDYSGSETGTVDNGTDTLAFTEIEEIITGSGNDTVLGDVGNDVVSTGAGTDTISGGAGDDTFDAGSGADTIAGGIGDDSITAGTGDDTIVVENTFGNDAIAGGEDAGDGDTDILDGGALTEDVTVDFSAAETGTIDNGTDTAGFSEIEEIVTGSGDDTVLGDVGDDVVSTGAGADTLSGGAGDDTFDAGSGADTIAGGVGNDSITAGTGDDTIVVEDTFGNDTIGGGEDVGGGDTDVLDGSTLTEDVTVDLSAPETGTITNGTDTASFSDIEEIVTGSGDDTVTGGTGADTVSTGAGNDQITFSNGDDIDAGADDDTLTLDGTGPTSNGTITIDGGDEERDGTGALTGSGDTLQLGNLADFSTLVKTTEADGSFSGSIELLDGTTVNFTDIERVVCFTPDTKIATPQGARPIETLTVGDLVVTRDHGLQPIRWIGSRTVEAKGKFAPIRIRPGAVTGLETDLLVSPQHRMLFTGYRAELLFGEREVLMPALHLVEDKHVTRETGGEVTYIHMMFDSHEVIYAEGAASESFHPGEDGLQGVVGPAREELFALFPELRSNPNGYGPAARRCLKKHETQMLRV